MTGQTWKLPSPLPHLAYGDLIQLLLDAGVRPPKHARLGTPWSIKDLAGEINRSPRQLLNIRKGRNLPHPQTHDFIVQAFCGRTLTTYPEIRDALSDAYRHATSAAEWSAQPEPQDDDAASLTSAPLTLPKHLPIRIPAFFYGRTGAIEQIFQILNHGVGRAIVVGPHGVGKTTVAASYAQTYREHYDAIAWIDARTPESTQQGLISFGQVMRWVGPDAPVEDTLDQIAGCKLRILLIYDNAGNSNRLIKLIPNGKAQILVTSNYTSWSHEGRVVHLAPWSIESAVGYLTDRLQTSDRDAATTLATRLKGLPLALDLAATFCERRQLRLADYERLLAINLGKALPVSNPLPNYAVDLVNVIRLTRQAAEAEAPGAEAALEVLSVIDQGILPESFLVNGRAALAQLGIAPSTEDDMQRIIDTLCNWSLIERRTEHLSPRQANLSGVAAHFLTALAVRAEMHDLARVRQTAAMLLTDGWPHDYPNRYDFTRRIHFHCAALRDHGSPTRESMRLHQRLAIAWEQLNDFRLAFAHARCAHVMACRLNLQVVPDVVLNMARLGRSCRAFRDSRCRTARILLTGALAHMQSVLSAFHPAKAQAALDLADVCILLHDSPTADRLREMVFEQRHGFWPKSLEGAADAYAARGSTYARRCDTERAVPLLCRALVEQVETRGWKIGHCHDAAETLFELFVGIDTREATEAIVDFSLPLFSRRRSRPDYTAALARLAIAIRAQRGFPELANSYAAKALPHLPKASDERFYAFHVLTLTSQSQHGILHWARCGLNEARASRQNQLAGAFAVRIVANLGYSIANLDERNALIHEFRPDDPSVTTPVPGSNALKPPTCGSD